MKYWDSFYTCVAVKSTCFPLYAILNQSSFHNIPLP